MAKPKRTRVEQAEATRHALVETARRLFVEKGYAATATEELVVHAGVGSRGALYHHFADKQALFEAVFTAVQTELAEQIGAHVAHDGDDALEALRTRLLAFLDCVVERADARVLLTDGPSALGWHRFRETEVRHGAGPIQALLDEARRTGVIADVPTRQLTLLLIATVETAALEIAGAEARDQTRHAMGLALDGLISGLRITDDAAHGATMPTR
jgi:AcrR family transcriptional regulator